MGITKSDTAKVMIEVLGRIDEEVESAIETLEVLSDESMLRGIEEGLRDIKAGRILSFEDFLKKHGRR